MSLVKVVPVVSASTRVELEHTAVMKFSVVIATYNRADGSARDARQSPRVAPNRRLGSHRRR